MRAPHPLAGGAELSRFRAVVAAPLAVLRAESEHFLSAAADRSRKTEEELWAL
ncbi:hypothetical protein ACFT5C_31390 [Streptomyces sp. NPDC057116]|uniref:hypothetical protein n=1 Tax=Streptomyces sp. NPDC057116 TaxID=3346023 RepID=UPI003627EE30